MNESLIEFSYEIMQGIILRSRDLLDLKGFILILNEFVIKTVYKIM